MRKAALLLPVCLLLAGCIIFDKKSEAVTFHQLVAPAAGPTRAAPSVYVPRAIVPSGLRRANLVLLDDAGNVRIEDGHRWIAPLDRALAEAVGRHLTARSGLPVAHQTPPDTHLVLLLTVDRMEIAAAPRQDRPLLSLPGMSGPPDNAVLQLTYRLERDDGVLIRAETVLRSRALANREPATFVRAQSANLAEIAEQIAQALPAPSR